MLYVIDTENPPVFYKDIKATYTNTNPDNPYPCQPFTPEEGAQDAIAYPLKKVDVPYFNETLQWPIVVKPIQ
jgi:hypothetical protein